MPWLCRMQKVLNRHGRVLALGPALARFPAEAPLAIQPLCQRLPSHKGFLKSLLIFPLHKRWNKMVPSSPKLLPVFCSLVPTSAAGPSTLSLLFSPIINILNKVLCCQLTLTRTTGRELCLNHPKQQTTYISQEHKQTSYPRALPLDEVIAPPSQYRPPKLLYSKERLGGPSP